MTILTGVTGTDATTSTARRSGAPRVLVLPLLPVGAVLPWVLWRALLLAGAALLAAALVALLVLGIGGVADVPLGPASVPVPRPAGF